MSAITSLYTLQDWQVLAQDFLNESNGISFLHAPQSYYTVPDHRQERKGYYGALVEAVSKGINHQSLQPDNLLGWVKMISEELALSGMSTQEQQLSSDIAARLVQTINDVVLRVEKNQNDTELVSSLAESMVLVEKECSDLGVRRQLAHLIASYMRSYFGSPLIVFGPKDVSYSKAMSDPKLAKIFLVDKVRESVFYYGLLMHRIATGIASDQYASGDGRAELRVEWHHLVRACRDWSGQQR